MKREKQSRLSVVHDAFDMLRNVVVDFFELLEDDHDSHEARIAWLERHCKKSGPPAKPKK